MSKSAVITGASQGLGLELAKEGIRRGYKVFALDVKISDELKNLKGENCNIYICDVTNYASVKECRDNIGKNTESVDILFNNAGIWLDNERRELNSPEFDFDIIFRQYDVNAVGVVRMVREFVGLVQKSETKCIINISSEAASIEDCRRKGEYGYCMSKAAQNMATKLMQNAYADIKFYSIHPGWMITPQGMAGASKDSVPSQKPSETANCLYDMAEKKNVEFLYCDYKGNKLRF